MNIANQLEEIGFCFLPAFRKFDKGLDVLPALGNISTIGSERLVHSLVPRRIADSTPNTYSGIYGFGEFPLHTDFAVWFRPPRYLALRCVNGFDDVVTSVFDSRILSGQIDTDLLYRSIVKPRRPVAGVTTSLRLFDEIEDIQIFRWDIKYIVPANNVATSIFMNINRLLEEKSRTEFRLSHPGDTLIIDNWRMLHGRSKVPEHCSGRIIERAYLDTVHDI